MTLPKPNFIQITPARKEKLSRGQMQFNDLVKKIDQLKIQLREWHDFSPIFHKKLAGEYEVVCEDYNAARVDLVYFFDKTHDSKGFKRKEKEKIKDAILDLLIRLLTDQPTDELKALHDKYCDVNFDEQEEEIGDAMKAIVEAMLGEKLGDDVDLNDTDKLQAFIDAKRAEHDALVMEAERQKEEKRAKRKKTAKQLEREAHQEAEERNLQKSIQDIYRKLVALLHPDREPDEVERERKTELMRRLNVAYGKKDLLQLFELQLETEKIDQTRINSISADRLKYYNKILSNQVEDLHQEIDQAEYPYRQTLRLSPWDKITPRKVKSHLNADIKSLKAMVAHIREDLLAFQNPDYFKTWLKHYQIEARPSDESMLDALFSDESMFDFTPKR